MLRRCRRLRSRSGAWERGLQRSVPAIALLLWGCRVGPDFAPPVAPEVSGYTGAEFAVADSMGSTPAAPPQQLRAGQDIPGQWWTLFRSPALDALVREAIAANPDLAAARANLRQAQELAQAKQGSLFPQIDAQLGYSRQQLSTASTGGVQSSANLYTLATAQVNVSYTLDIFGGTQRQIESLVAAADQQRYQMEAAYLTLTSNVVADAVQEASLRAQVAATEEILDILRQQLEVVRGQLALGGASMSDVLTQQTTLAQTEATLPVMKRQLAQQRNQLAVLAGRFPNEGIGQRFDLVSLTLPRELPLSVPSRLVAQRPDVQSASAALHQATAQVGVATANMLPQITLTGSIGDSSLHLRDMFSPGTALWSIGGALLQPVFQGGTLRHQREAAMAAMEAAAAQYQSTVLTAFQNVADALHALQSDADAVAANRRALDAATAALEIARAQFRFGGVSYLSLLTAERAYAQARISLVQALASRYADTAALFQALGGGWWNRDDVTPAVETGAGTAAATRADRRTEP